MPEISVIMPVYNTKVQYLQPAVASILNQTFTDFELLIIDDCSTEDISEAIKDFADPRIRFVKAEKNGGAGQARNLGLSQAKGKYVALMDSDDIARPQRLQIEYDYLEHHPQINILGSYMQRFPQKKTLKVPLKHEDIIHENIFLNCALNNPSVMFRRNKSISYEPERRVAEDYGVWLAQADKLRFANLPESLIDYRWEGQNITVTHNSKQSLSTAELQTAKWIEIAQSGMEHQTLLIKFVCKETLSEKEIAEVAGFITRLLQKTEETTYLNRSKALKYLQKLLKRIIRKTPDKDYARRLCRSPLAKALKLPFLFKLKIKLGK